MRLTLFFLDGQYHVVSKTMLYKNKTNKNINIKNLSVKTEDALKLNDWCTATESSTQHHSFKKLRTFKNKVGYAYPKL